MVLEEFRHVGDIAWDLVNGRVRPGIIEVKSSGIGNIIGVAITDAGVEENLTGYTLSLAWQHPVNGTSGLDVFTATDITKGIYEIALTTGMLTNLGRITASLYLSGGSRIFESRPFIIMNTITNLDETAAQSQNSYTTLETMLSWFDYSDKARTTATLQNGWTGSASYRYLGNGLTEIAGAGLGTGTIDAAGVTIFSIPSNLAPANTAVGIGYASGLSPFTGLVNVHVTSAGLVKVKTVPGSTVGGSNATAGIQFNFVISSATL